MRVAIYGAGAMGTILGAYIAASGRQIDLITRNVKHVEAMKEHGAHVLGNANFTVRVNALTPDEMTGVYDIIFLMTKQRENHKILPTLRDFLADDGVICTLQNGLPEPSVIEAVGSKRCLGCAVGWGANIIGDGVAELTSEKDKMSFALGSMRGDNPWLPAVKEYLECAGKVTVEENFFGARWAKLAINSAFSTVSAVTGYTFGEVVGKFTTRRLALRLLNEAFDVAEKCGVEIGLIQGRDIVSLFRCKGPIKKITAFAMVPFAIRGHGKLTSGMNADLKQGKKCDIDFVNGVIQRLGNKFDVETPLTDRIIELAHQIERGEKNICPENAKLLLKNRT